MAASGEVVLDLELLGQEGGIDAGEGCRIFVANLLDRVEALAAARVVRLVKCFVQRLEERGRYLVACGPLSATAGVARAEAGRGAGIWIRHRVRCFQIFHKFGKGRLPRTLPKV